MAGKYPSTSSYVFALNSPLSYIDPDGEDPVIRIKIDENGHTTITIIEDVYVIVKSESGAQMPQQSYDAWEAVPNAFPSYEFSDKNLTLNFEVNVTFVENLDASTKVQAEANQVIVAQYDPEAPFPAYYDPVKAEVKFRDKYNFTVRGEQELNEYQLASEVQHDMGYADQYIKDIKTGKMLVLEEYANTLQGTANVPMTKEEANKIVYMLEPTIDKMKKKGEDSFQDQDKIINTSADIPYGKHKAGRPVSEKTKYPTYKLENVKDYKVTGKWDTGSSAPMAKPIEK